MGAVQVLIRRSMRDNTGGTSSHLRVFRNPVWLRGPQGLQDRISLGTAATDSAYAVTRRHGVPD